MIRRNHAKLLSFLDRRTVARWLGVPLPRAARELRYVDWQPSGDLAYHEALVCFRASKEDYLALVQARGLALFSSTGPAGRLPFDWSPPPEMQRPDWWTPSPETPPDAATGTLGLYGKIAAKWEGGRVFLVIEDTGHRAARRDGGKR
jgi:hypothetical protein